MEKAFFDFVSILNKLKIPWWLDKGQLLRLYREGSFALNEVDFDIGVFYSDMSKTVIKTILDSGYSYWFLMGEKDSMAVGFHKDQIYFFQIQIYYIENSMMRYSIYLSENKLLMYNPTELELSKFKLITGKPDQLTKTNFTQRFDAFHNPFKTKKIIYKDYKINVPENIERHLTEIYGEDWKTPAKVWYTFKMQANLKPTTIAGRVYPTFNRTVLKHKDIATDGKIKSDLLISRKLDNSE